MYISSHETNMTVERKLHQLLWATRGHKVQLVAILALGTLLYWVSEFHPSAMPVWGPWDFSWLEYLATALAVVWFFRGLGRMPLQARLPAGRRIAFVLGMAALYGVTQTRFDYMAQHMFFINRIQHIVMHHVGPFLIALGCAGRPISRAGSPDVVDWRFTCAMQREYPSSYRHYHHRHAASWQLCGGDPPGRGGQSAR